MARTLRNTVLCSLVCLAAFTSHACSDHPADHPAGLDAAPVWDNADLANRSDDPAPLTAQPVLEPLAWNSSPVDIQRWPGSDRLLVAELDGHVWTLRESADAPHRDLLLHLTAGPNTHLMLYSVALHPRFPDVPHLYVAWNQRKPKPAVSRVSRFTVTDPGSAETPPRVDPDSRLDIIAWESDGHDGCDLRFGPTDRMLYISTGDGQVPGDPANLGQTTDNLLGSILRIDVREASAASPYRVPVDNPFVGVKGVRAEVWAYGLRNPWKMAFNQPTGDLIVGDNGDEAWELVRVVRKGSNHGWSTFEGSHPFRLTAPLAGPTAVLTPPIIEHPHHIARSVIGGPTYTGDKLPMLTGRHLYADYVTGQVWAFAWDGKAVSNHTRVATTGAQIVCFGVGHNGDVYLGQRKGPLLRLTPVPPEQLATIRPLPERLSDTGLFASTAEHRVAPGVIPYGVNAAQWADGAARRRYVAVPEKGAIRNWSKRGMVFPDGSAFVQTFTLPATGNGSVTVRRIETQLIHNDAGVWRFYTYRWLDDQSDAVLVGESGELINVEVADATADGGRRTQPWRFMSRAECATCHTHEHNFVLGLTSPQLNRTFDYAEVGGKPGNQLATLDRLGLLQKPLAEWGDVEPLIDPHNDDADVAARARAYLHANCAHCHREGGVAGRAEFKLDHWVPLEEAGLVNVKPKLPLLAGPDAVLIAPGDPDRSELYRRMSVRGAGQMPLFGSYEVDEQGAALIRRWIESMK